MSIDFSSLVLAPSMDTFSYPVTVTPLISQPNVAPYLGRGIWHIDNINIVTESGGLFSNRTIKLGVMMSDYVVLPTQGDWITTLVANLPLGYWQGVYLNPATATIDFIIDDQNTDGQGGASLTLKRIV